MVLRAVAEGLWAPPTLVEGISLVISSDDMTKLQFWVPDDWTGLLEPVMGALRARLPRMQELPVYASLVVIVAAVFFMVCDFTI